MDFDVNPPASFGLGGRLGDEVSDLPGVLVLSETLFGADFGVLVEDLVAVSLTESVVLCDWLSLEVALEAGFLPDLVGVLGGLEGVLPAAGEGAILLDERAVWGEGVLEPEEELWGGEDRLGVGGKE